MSPEEIRPESELRIHQDPLGPRDPTWPRDPMGGVDPSHLDRELKNHRRVLESILGSFDCCVLSVDRAGDLVEVDDAACALLGYLPDEVIGQPASLLIELAEPGAGTGSLPELLLSGRREISLIDSTGQRTPAALAACPWSDAEGQLDKVVCVCTDLTSVRQAQLEQSNSQKLESVGQLAAGIAHEINTPIQFIGDSTRFLQDSFSSLERILGGYRHLLEAVERGEHGQHYAGHVKEVRRLEEAADIDFLQEEIPQATSQTLEGIERVATIVRAMRSFAHPGRSEKTPHDLNDALQTTLTVARNEYKYLADVQLNLSPIPEVSCNLGELNQVFLNLIINAAHAIADRVGRSGERGVIGIRTELQRDWVEVQISDTGSGIPLEIQDRIFDPYFTTKEVGRGTGQGLALARKIISDGYGGQLEFQSTPGEGTTFFIRLPIRSSRRSAA